MRLYKSLFKYKYIILYKIKKIFNNIYSEIYIY